MKSVRPPPLYEMISQKIFFFTIDGFPKSKKKKYPDWPPPKKKNYEYPRLATPPRDLKVLSVSW